MSYNPYDLVFFTPGARIVPCFAPTVVIAGRRGACEGITVVIAPVHPHQAAPAPRRATGAPAPGRPNQAATAIVVDRWPLMRVGLRRALTMAEIRTVGETEEIGDGVHQVRSRGAVLLVLGELRPGELDQVRRLTSERAPPKVVGLVPRTDRGSLAAILSAGVDGVGLRSVPLDELAEMVRRVCAGERTIGPGVLPGLVGFVAPEAAGAAGAPTTVLLTLKERQVLGRLAMGSTNQQIAEALYVTPATVKTHLAHIYEKLGVRSRHEAVSLAVALGMVV